MADTLLGQHPATPSADPITRRDRWEIAWLD
jgi:hypothetical protein